MQLDANYIRDLYEERAAIREFDGLQSRNEAEKNAVDDVVIFMYEAVGEMINNTLKTTD